MKSLSLWSTITGANYHWRWQFRFTTSVTSVVAHFTVVR